MNVRFEQYINGLTPSKKAIANEALQEYLTGCSEQFDILNDSWALYQKVRHLSGEQLEHAYVIMMKQNFRFIKAVEVSVGGLTNCIFDVRVILRTAIINNATVIAIAHNHPSGSIVPSADDNRVTEKIKNACKLVGIHLCDHIIVGEERYYSYSDKGAM